MEWRRHSLALLAALFLAPALSGQAPPDSVANLTLEQAVLTAHVERPMLETLSGVSGSVNVAQIQALPSFLGNADPIRFVRLLPGIQVNAETDAGIYMQGSDFAHTLLSIGGVPVYGASHLLGLFSVFNAPHYKAMDYSTDAGQIRRLGGHIDMTLQDAVPERFGMDVSAGLISAQGTLSIPLGKKSALFVSARRSYINLIYGSFLKFDGEPMRYGFTDANITWLWRPSPRDRVWVDLFGGYDKGSFDYSKASISMMAGWYNGLGALHWTHYFPEVTLRQSAYATISGLESHLDVRYAVGDLPSHIHTYGYKADAVWKAWDFTADLAYHRALPQNPKSEGYYNATNTASETVQSGLETTLAATYNIALGYYFEGKAGLGFNGFLSPEKRFFWGLTPQVEAGVNLMDAGKLKFRYGIHRQNLFQTGFTNVGLPSEFWILAGALSDPQWSHNFSLSYNLSFAKDMFACSVEVYYKRLYNQLEYKGTLMEMLNSDYSLANSLLKGHGYAYGVNLLLQKQTGRLTGWIGYSYGRSLRNFEDPHYPGTYPSDHERLHELNVVATYDIGRFDFGGTFVAASGTPYTRPESFYILGDRLICNYGEHNGSRLPAYIRMDLSVNWYIHKDARRHNGINLSIYNVLCRENAVGYGVHVNKDRTGYYFAPMAFAIKFMPSLSYFHKF